MIKVPEYKLIKFEEDLNKVFFNGIPLGGTLVNYLQVIFLIGRNSTSKVDHLKERIRTFYISYIGIHFVRKKRKKISADLPRDKGLLTFISARPHLFRINYNIWRQNDSQQFNCLLKDESLSSLFEKKPQYLLWNELPFPGLNIWRNAFGDIKNSLRKIVASFVNDNQLPTMFITQMMNELAVQTQYILAYELLIEQLKPKYILCEYDRNSQCAGLMLLAKNKNIPTYSHMHGVVNHRFGYLPIFADYIFCWGERQKQLLIDKGADPSQLIVSGATQLSNQIKVDQEKVRAKLALGPKQKVVLLATNPVNDEYRNKLARIFCESIKELEELKGVIRLHPSEDLAFYQKFIDEYPNILFDKNEVFLFEESFALADLVCVFNSAYGIDALIKNIPVMIINLDDHNLGQAEDLIHQGGSPVAKNKNELRALVLHYFDNQDFRNELLLNQRKYVERYCLAFEKSAAKNITICIQEHISSTIPVHE